MRKRASRVITLILIIIILIPVSFGLMENGHFLEFGQEVKGETDTIYYSYDRYSVTKDAYPTDNIFYVSASGAISYNRDSCSYRLVNQKLEYYYMGSGLPTIATWDIKKLYQTYTDIEIHDMYSTGGYGDNEPKAYCSLQGKKFSKGPLIVSNIAAPDNTYPDNGIHTDGYWYIKKGLADNIPKTYYSYDQCSVNKELYPTNNIFRVSVSSPIDYYREECAFTLENQKLIFYYTGSVDPSDWISSWDIKPLYQTYVDIDIDEWNSYGGYWDDDGKYHEESSWCSLKGTKITKGSLVRNIAAPDGTYPDNGIFSDGYWYVKKGTLSINSPSANEVLSKGHGCTPSITVSDPDGDTLTCKYYIDSVAKETKSISNTATAQQVNFSAIDVSTLSDGKHTLKFEVSDGNASPIIMSVDVIVDNSPPVIGTVNMTTDATSMNISGSATDIVSDAASIQYRYTVGSTVSNWVSNTPYTITPLTPNTVYYVKCEARDKVGNVSYVEKTVRTKAQTPQITVSNNKETTLDLSISDSNPATTQYQIMAGSRYVNASGTLTSSPDWITVPGKKITVTGLTANTQYNFTIKAKNDEGIETAVTQKAGTTLALPPAINAEKGITSVKITWSAVSGATGYELEVDGRVLGNGTSTTYIQSGLQAETSHTYKLRVINAGGTGPWSNVVQAVTLPNPPETPVITETDTTQTVITINWDAVAKANGYEIEADGKIINTGINTTYKDEGLNPDSIHKYRIRAKNAGGYSGWSAYTEISTLPNPPEIPENLAGKPTMKNITLTWEAAERAEGYELEVDGRIVKVETNTYTHEGLSTNTNHKYRVRGYNKGGKSSWSELITVTTWPDIPAAPKNIMATAEQNSITLTWYSSPYAESYDVQVDEKDTVNIKETSYTNKNLEPGSKHSYKIRAINISGNGKWSSPIEISTLPLGETGTTTGAAIVANVAAVVTNRTVTIAWQAVEANAQYEIEVDGEVIDNGKDTVYNHAGLKAETFHTYRVRTKNANGNGQWCAVLALSTLPDLPGAPSNVNVTVTDTQIQLTWTKEEGVSYEVEADGKSIDVGQVSSYIDENLSPGTAHTYRVRGKNVTGVTAWSDSITKSTTSPAYEVSCTQGEEFDFSMLAANVQDFGDITFVVTYNPDELEVVDLCEFTADKETASGVIPGTSVTVTVTEGRIEFKVNESITPGTTWSGEISTIVFRSKTDGTANINYSFE